MEVVLQPPRRLVKLPLLPAIFCTRGREFATESVVTWPGLFQLYHRLEANPTLATTPSYRLGIRGKKWIFAKKHSWNGGGEPPCSSKPKPPLIQRKTKGGLFLNQWYSQAEPPHRHGPGFGGYSQTGSRHQRVPGFFVAYLLGRRRPQHCKKHLIFLGSRKRCLGLSRKQEQCPI